MTDQPLKQCRSCLTYLPLDDFYLCRSGVQGRHSYCKVCHREYSKQAMRRLRERNR